MVRTGLVCLLVGGLLGACGDGGQGDGFGRDFLFGVATAGFQVEMGCPGLAEEVCADRGSDWYAYVTDAAVRERGVTKIYGGDPVRTGPGHWELYAADYDLAAEELANNAFRMSLEWSRIFPESTVGVSGHEALRAVADEAALQTYHAMFAAMRARGLEPLVTLHHYTIPLWLHDAVTCTLDFDACQARGWLDRERMVAEIAKYAGFAAREFGGQVDLWATLNEPFAVIISGFLYPSEERTNPPARMLDADGARTALLGMIEAHARMVDAVRDNDVLDASGDGSACRLGVVAALAPVLPADGDDPLDRQAARNTFYLWNLLFLDATAAGRLDDDLDGVAEARAGLRDRMDYIGVNYKMSIQVEGLEGSLLPELSPLLTVNPLNLDMSLVQPRGLYEMSQLLAERYGLPLIITENNGRQLWRGALDAEADYLAQNLQWLQHARAQGLDIRGYFYWAFMDNYEWNHGMTVDLGLYAVDPEDPDKRRQPRSELVELYRQVAAERRVPPALRQAHPIDLDQPPTGGVPDSRIFTQGWVQD